MGALRRGKRLRGAAELTGTSVGQKMLGVAFGLQICGLYAIRKLTTVKV